MTEHKRENDRVSIRGLHGEVTVYQPMVVLEISERGAQIDTDFALHLDSLHDFRLPLGDISVVVKGRIVHSQIGELGGEVARYRTGVEFVELSEHARTAIRAFVEGHRVARSAAPAIIDAEIAE